MNHGHVFVIFSFFKSIRYQYSIARLIKRQTSFSSYELIKGFEHCDFFGFDIKLNKVPHAILIIKRIQKLWIATVPYQLPAVHIIFRFSNSK